MDYIGATPMQNPIMGLLAERLKQAQEFAAKPFGYSNPPAEMLMNLLGIPAVQQTAERIAYGEPLTTGRGMTTQIRPEAVEAALTVAPTVGLLGKTAERGAMAAGRAGERYAEKVVPQIMERGGLPAQLLGDLSQGSIRPMDVWHGSPYKFGEFDASKIGTGEGAQAYGYGHYAAQSRETGDTFRKSGQLGYAEKEADNLIFFKKDIDKAIEQAKKELDYVTSNKAPKSTIDEVQSVLKVLENRKSGADEFGYLYKADLPDEQIEKMLDFDKPLKDQTPEIKALAKKYGLTDDDHLGGDLVAAMRAKTPAGAESMRKSGIPGIKYLDQDRRGVVDKTSNFVVFPGNEDLLKIKEINDKPYEQWFPKTNLLD